MKLEQYNVLVKDLQSEQTDLTYSGSWSSKRQAEKQRQWADFLSGQDIGQRQTAIITTVPRMHRLENISQLQEIKTDNRRGQDRELQ